jgi:glycosyltransferase involved in cell wall biosynthesis
MIAYGHIFAEIGSEVTFVIHPDYKHFAEFADNDAAIVATTPAWDTSRQYQHAIICNPARDNLVHSVRLRKNGCKVWYLYHEPWVSIGAYLRTESPIITAKLICAHYLSVKILKAADGVILSSAHAVEAYRRHDYRYNRNYFEIPLLFDDESQRFADEERRYFSYIGNITRAHGFDGFIRLIKFSLENDLDIQFLIASRRPLPREVAEDPVITCNPDRVVVQCGRPLSNDEINRCYARSFCVWNIYRRSTQSGVLAKATMFGTPLLASEVGSFREFISDGCEGRLLQDAAPETVLGAYEDIKSNLNRYTMSSRKRFLSTFHYRSQLDICRKLFLDACKQELME